MPHKYSREELRDAAEQWLRDAAPQAYRRVLGELKRPAPDTDRIVACVNDVLLNHRDREARLRALGFLFATGLARDKQEDAHLLLALCGADDQVRTAVFAFVEGRLREGSRRYVRVLIQAMASDSLGLRYNAVRAWRKLGVDIASGALPDIVRLLQDGDAGVRLQAVLLLAWLGPDARDALPAVVELAVRDEDGAVRREGLLALRKIDPEGTQAVELLGRITDPGSRPALLEGLEDLGEPGRPLRRALRDVWSGRPRQAPPGAAQSPPGPGTPPGLARHPDGPVPPNHLPHRPRGAPRRAAGRVQGGTHLRRHPRLAGAAGRRARGPAGMTSGCGGRPGDGRGRRMPGSR
jgi:hypothetical protein